MALASSIGTPAFTNRAAVLSRSLRVGLAHRLQQILADAGRLESVDAFGPDALWVKDGRHVDYEAAQGNIEGRRHA
jgi:hypothetical protein